MNKEIAGIFIYNGQPQNGATAKLFNITSFATYADSTATVQDNPLSPTAVEVNTSDGTVFAAGDVIKAESECLLVLAVATNKLYIIRGYHGTTAAAHIQGTVIYDETVTEPIQDLAEPGSGQEGGTITTGVAYGGDGAYRWTGVTEGEFYVMVEYDSHRSYIYYDMERDDPSPEQLLTVDGDIMIRDATRVTRLATVRGDILVRDANRIAALSTTTGDTIYRNATDVVTLAKSTDGKVLKLVGGFPAWGTDKQTVEVFIPVTYGTNGISLHLGIPVVAALTALNDVANIEFRIPSDFSAITTAIILVVPIVTDAAANWDIYTNYGAIGEGYSTHAESDVATTYNVNQNVYTQVSIAGILSSLAADDYVSVQLKLADADDDVSVVGVYFKYTTP